MTPRTILDGALGLLSEPPPSMRRCWPRGCACLTRMALEEGLRRYWAQAAPSVVGRPMRHQLLMLPRYPGNEAAALARSAWHGLSRAMHHHCYELAPTAAELRGWHQDVERLLRLLDEEAAASPASHDRSV